MGLTVTAEGTGAASVGQVRECLLHGKGDGMAAEEEKEEVEADRIQTGAASDGGGRSG